MTRLEIVLKSFAICSFFSILFLIWLSPYVVLSKVAKEQFGSDFKYVFLNYSDRTELGRPKSFCAENVYHLRSIGFLVSAANIYLNMVRPDEIPIHAAVYKGKDVHIWSFGEMRYVLIDRGTIVYNIQEWACERADG